MFSEVKKMMIAGMQANAKSDQSSMGILASTLFFYALAVIVKHEFTNELRNNVDPTTITDWLKKEGTITFLRMFALSDTDNVGAPTYYNMIFNSNRGATIVRQAREEKLFNLLKYMFNTISRLNQRPAPEKEEVKPVEPDPLQKVVEPGTKQLPEISKVEPQEKKALPELKVEDPAQNKGDMLELNIPGVTAQEDKQTDFSAMIDNMRKQTMTEKVKEVSKSPPITQQVKEVPGTNHHMAQYAMMLRDVRSIQPSIRLLSNVLQISEKDVYEVILAITKLQESEKSGLLEVADKLKEKF